MINLTYFRAYVLLFYAALCLTSCSTLDLNAKKPENIDFSGSWELNAFLSGEHLEKSRSQSPRQNSDLIRTEDIKRTDLSDPFVFVSHDFHIVDAQLLTIELDTLSVGLHYQPGTYRDVTFGQRRRGLWDIQAGWDDMELVILSRANNLKVIERITLVSPKRLRVTVNIEAEKKNRYFVKVFDQR